LPKLFWLSHRMQQKFIKDRKPGSKIKTSHVLPVSTTWKPVTANIQKNILLLFKNIYCKTNVRFTFALQQQTM